MSRFASAYVSIHGKAFVEMDDLYEALAEKYPSKIRWDEEEAEWIDDTTGEERRDVFLELAMQQISDLFPSDIPMKHGEISIDMDSYRD